MIVSCESCKSRYKLDDSKITGRGAKITCPKCKHVFVVLAPPSSIVDSPKPSMLPQTAAGNEWEDDEPTRVGREGAAAVAQASASPPAASAPPAAAPTEPATPPEHEVVRPRAAAAAPAAPTKEAVAARAATLDFRKVGVTAWKVKVRIGLVYDFSDIKTLRKYIQDGRVTAADVISHDGKAWKPIGEIPDLDGFFVESYEALEKDYAGKSPPERSNQPSPADLGNVAAALAAAAAAELDAPPGKGPRTEPTGPVYTDPFETMKQCQRDRGPAKKGKPDQKKNNTPTYAVLLVLLVALGAFGWWQMGRDKGTVAPPKPPPKAAALKASEENEGPVFKEVELPSGNDAAPPGGAGALPAPQADASCIKYIQGKCVTGPVGGPGPGSSAAAGSGAKTQGAGGSGSPPPLQTQKTTDNDNMAIGDDFMRQKDYNSAVTAFSAAVGEGLPGANVRLGEAQWRAGDQAGGGSTLMGAAASNAKAWKVLGQLKEESGDAAGAKDAYGSYLKKFPKDAAIKARVEALGG